VTAFRPISKFPEVDYADARGELATTYDEIQCTLRVPWVAFAIRVMSQFPELRQSEGPHPDHGLE
jgi:hypothetical protein